MKNITPKVSISPKRVDINQSFLDVLQSEEVGNWLAAEEPRQATQDELDNRGDE
jgi:hypothetical protein